MNGGEQGPRDEGDRVPQAVVQAADDFLARAMPDAIDAEQQRPAPSERPPDAPEEREADDERPSPRIFVASLSDYNAGRLHGGWIDATQPLEDIWSDIGDMLAQSVEPEAEEWAIHDYEGFGPLQLGEFESMEFISEAVAGIAEHGEAFAAFAELADRDPDRLWMFDGMYQGRWDSVAAYAARLLDELGVEEVLGELPEWVRPYLSVDVQALANELQTGGTVMTVEAADGGVYVIDFDFH